MLNQMRSLTTKFTTDLPEWCSRTHHITGRLRPSLHATTPTVPPPATTAVAAPRPGPARSSAVTTCNSSRRGGSPPHPNAPRDSAPPQRSAQRAPTQQGGREPLRKSTSGGSSSAAGGSSSSSGSNRRPGKDPPPPSSSLPGKARFRQPQPAPEPPAHALSGAGRGGVVDGGGRRGAGTPSVTAEPSAGSSYGSEEVAGLAGFNGGSRAAAATAAAAVAGEGAGEGAGGGGGAGQGRGFRRPTERSWPPLLQALLRAVRPLEEAGYAYCAVRRTAAWLQGVPLPPSAPDGEAEDLVVSGDSAGSSLNGNSQDGSSTGNVQEGSTPMAAHRQGSPPAVPVASLAGSGGLLAPGGASARAERTADGPEAGDPTVLNPDPDPDPGPRRCLDSDLDLEVQWDQMQTVHELFGRPGSGWVTCDVRQLPGGRARFYMTAATPIGAAAAVAGGSRSSASATASSSADGRGSDSGSDNGHSGFLSAEATPVAAASAAPTGSASAPSDGAAAVSSMSPFRASYGKGPAAAAAASPVTVSITCTYNTVLRANPARVLVTPSPPELRRAAAATLGVRPGGAGIRDGVAASGGGSGGDIRGGDQVRSGGGAARGSLLEVLTAAGPASATSAAGGSEVLPQVWVQSLYSVALEAERCGEGALAAAVEATMVDMQRELSTHNTAAWGRDTAYDAWVARFGPPQEAAARLLRDPERCLGPLLPYLSLPGSPPLPGLAVINLLGSHGHKAVALAAMGAARVVVADASAGNAAYARELAAAAGLAHAVSYVVCDVAELAAELRRRRGAATANAAGGVTSDEVAAEPYSSSPSSSPLAPGQFDLVLMEMGVLHYFLDLRVLMRDLVAPLLRPGGRFLLREFHPVSTKLLSSRGKKHKVTGDYFVTQPLATVDVAYSKYEEAAAAAAGRAAGTAADSAPLGPGPEWEACGDVGGGAAGRGGGGGGRPSVLLRRWGLGEVVSAVAGSGALRVVLLDEEPGARLDDAGLPKLFTLLAEKDRC